MILIWNELTVVVALMAESGISLDSIPRGETHSENYTTNKGYSAHICIIITDANKVQRCQKLSFSVFLRIYVFPQDPDSRESLS